MSHRRSFSITFPGRAAIVLFAMAVALSPGGGDLEAQVGFREPDLARISEGDIRAPNTAAFLINREATTRRAVHLGRSLFHRDFADSDESGCNGLPCSRRHEHATRQGPDSRFEASSCATCHTTPFGSAGFGPREQDWFARGNRIRTPDMFGGGLIQQLAREATEDLRAARLEGRRLVTANGVRYDEGLGVRKGGTVDPDLVVRPFGRKGVESHVRAFASRAAFSHMGIQAQDRFQCPDGDSDGDGRCDGPVRYGLDPDGDGIADELTQGSLSLLEHFLINYPIPGRGPITPEVEAGESLFKRVGCATCHVPEMRIREDPRIEHISVFWNPERGRFEAERRFLFDAVDDGYVDPTRRRSVRLARPRREPFVVRLYSDLRRHDLGPERADSGDEEGVGRAVFLTRPLWGVGSYTAFFSDGSAGTIREAILRHGGEAANSRDRFRALSDRERELIKEFLRSHILFSVDDILGARIPITRGDLP